MKKGRHEPCTACQRKIPINWPLGPIPFGHPQLSDHGYVLCGACRNKQATTCPACKGAPKLEPKKIEIDDEGQFWIAPHNL